MQAYRPSPRGETPGISIFGCLMLFEHWFMLFRDKVTISWFRNKNACNCWCWNVENSSSSLPCRWRNNRQGDLQRCNFFLRTLFCGAEVAKRRYGYVSIHRLEIEVLGRCWNWHFSAQGVSRRTGRDVIRLVIRFPSQLSNRESGLGSQAWLGEPRMEQGSQKWGGEIRSGLGKLEVDWGSQEWLAYNLYPP